MSKRQREGSLKTSFVLEPREVELTLLFAYGEISQGTEAYAEYADLLDRMARFKEGGEHIGYVTFTALLIRVAQN